MAAKSFEPGSPVEVRRDVGKPWETASYRMRTKSMRGWHTADLAPDSPPRIVDTMTGVELSEATDRTFETRRVNVPSQRIRAKETK